MFGSDRNFGWLLQAQSENKDKYYRLYSSEHPRSSKRPKLVVVANVPSGTLAKGGAASKNSAASISGFQLEQNYPNPFNPETVIRYTIPEAGQVRLAIYNTLGQRIRVLVDNTQNAGQHQITWDGRNQSGLQVPSGIYFYRLEMNHRSLIGKMSLLK